MSPRGVETTDDADDFTAQTVYDKLNRPIEKLAPFDKDDVQHKVADKTIYTYDPAGRIKEMSSPPSQGQTVRNITQYSYFDNGWVRSATDPWEIVTSYDYTPLGQQASRTQTSAGGSSSRTMTWDYYPDGKPKSRSDSGVPVGLHVALTDNSDTGFVELAGNWSTATAGQGFQGYDYRSTARGSGGTTFTWKPVIPQDGSYEVFVKYPAGVAGTATNAPHKVETGTATSTVAVNQTQHGGEWVSLGSFTFTAGNAAKVTVSDNAAKVTVSDNADGTVLADAVKLVRDSGSDPDNESKTFSQVYDANGNLTSLSDSSPGAKTDSYALTYNGLNQLTKIEEKLASVVQATTTFSYDENGSPLTRGHDKQSSEFSYNVLDLIERVQNTETGGSPKVTSYTYTDRGQVKQETKPNGNKVVYGYHLDGGLASQVESKADGTLVAQHLIDYSVNGHRSRDAAKIQNADNASAYLDEVHEYDYDPLDRVRKVTKKSAAGAVLETEDYVHDANSNVVSQSVDSTATTFNYDRNRLLSSTSSGVTSSYNYDPFGRLDSVTAAGQIVESFKYDGFDRTVEHRKQADGGGMKTTAYAYDPLDRTTAKTEDGKTTDFAYLGLTDKVVSETIAGQLQRTYQYDSFGQRLAQIKKDTDGTGPEVAEDSYYGYNPHTDVETLTKANGDTRATYGYTAYGKDDKEAFTGIDKPDVQQPGKEPFNFYRYNGKRFGPSSGSYDMGFRDYNPGLNRFTTRDTYNGALADMNLGSDTFTGNRYAFAGGNPITGVEADGHGLCADTGCQYVCSAECSSKEAYALSELMSAERPSAEQQQQEAWQTEYELAIVDVDKKNPGTREALDDLNTNDFHYALAQAEVDLRFCERVGSECRTAMMSKQALDVAAIVAVAANAQDRPGYPSRAESRNLVKAAVDRQLSRGWQALIDNHLDAGQRANYQSLIDKGDFVNSRKEIGTALHNAVDADLQKNHPGRFSYSASRGPDCKDNYNGVTVELATRKGFSSHWRKQGACRSSMYVLCTGPGRLPSTSGRGNTYGKGIGGG
ncbi:RHS repeat-associated core domain-containing protein [Lentzea sp. BCCO 10_0798]|uniref:RHS repeat-associated core domain-containing protein n=1 Tax=Lentzea kristufekii TaxID=3095430 RepID=A0ABU4U2D7_9PSEU|nr:RHS repeat-associated core domain-containing protein [Lentzea sp. BCCO 10_0798]MDX8054493.1 RHS repeat-associated core domain-containing protein [Lentzea sp. BCCO 10_0798]